MAEQGPFFGQKLGDRYLLGNLIGQGGFGVVYQIMLEQHFASPKFRERDLARGPHAGGAGTKPALLKHTTDAA